jgi:hypothetical protein
MSNVEVYHLGIRHFVLIVFYFIIGNSAFDIRYFMAPDHSHDRPRDGNGLTALWLAKIL